MLFQFPEQITAGVSLRAAVACAEYPSDEWVLTAYLRGPESITLTAAPHGAGFLFSENASVTAAWAPGDYAATLRVASGADIFPIEDGRLTILADIASAEPGHDPIGHAERTLRAIEAVLEARASRDQMSYAINGRSLQRTPIADLLLLKKHYQAQVAKVRNAGRARRLLGRKIRTRF